MAKKEVEEWLLKANKDLGEAKFLFENNRPLEDCAYFVHQTEEITNFYIESRYPVGYEVEYTKEEIEQAIKNAERISKIVIKKIK
ncbi:MAG: HEPN domain-containing protein [Candidatus Omnitrophica bacterium]|nr:HEPN domain-containing protein [Candidatus Omnitrophota bacterium]